MSDGPEDPSAPAERALMNALFSPEGRREPAAAARAVQVAGCSHAFATAALHDRQLTATPIPPSDDIMFQVAARFLARMDDAPHRAVRAAFTGLFSPRRVESYRARIEATSHQLIDAFPATGPIDIVTAFTRPLPFTVICEVVGVPDEERPWLAERMETFGRGVAGQRQRANVEDGNAATVEMLALFDDLLGQRKHHPTQDLLSLLAQSEAADERRDDILANCLFFVLAGHATTTALITAGIHLFTVHPDQLTSVLNDRTPWSLAIDELLRFVSPTTLTGVTAKEEADIAGTPIPAGASRAVVFAAANRDPAVFESPDCFDTTRSPNPHVAFSAGAHYCLGAPLARLHAEVALGLLFSRLPHLHAVDEPAWLGSVPIRQVAHLNVDWGHH